MPWYKFLVQYTEHERTAVKRKSFKHDGSSKDRERALRAARGFAMGQYYARIDEEVRTIVVQNAGQHPLE